MLNILDIISGTPLWVYVVFIYLVIKGLLALKDNVVSLSKMMIIPLLFLVWSIYFLVIKHGFSLKLLGVWSIPLFIGGLIGWYYFSRGITVNQKDRLVHIPGSPYSLILYIVFFAAKYALGVISALMPEMRSYFITWATDLIVSGLISGIFGGRFLNIWHNYIKK